MNRRWRPHVTPDRPGRWASGPGRESRREPHGGPPTTTSPTIHHFTGRLPSQAATACGLEPERAAAHPRIHHSKTRGSPITDGAMPIVCDRSCAIMYFALAGAQFLRNRLGAKLGANRVDGCGRRWTSVDGERSVRTRRKAENSRGRCVEIHRPEGRGFESLRACQRLLPTVACHDDGTSVSR
jgi:hypothetical protein